MNQKNKTKFRASGIWKKFRNYMRKKQNGIDPVTLKPLYKGANLHHLNLNEEYYDDISKEENFVFVNKKTHDAIHWLYNYYKTDADILKRLQLILENMKKINIGELEK